MELSLSDVENFAHAAEELSCVRIDSYNLELRDEEGFVGDRASGRAFNAILGDWRELLRAIDRDPLGERIEDAPKAQQLDHVLLEGDPKAAGLIEAAIADFARELAKVVRRFLREPAWQGTQRIVIGGGLRQGLIGALVIERAAATLKTEGLAIDIRPMHYDPNAAGLIGSVHLFAPERYTDTDALLAVDIGGTNIRAGVVEHGFAHAPDFSTAQVWKSEVWQHGGEADRESAVAHLLNVLYSLAQGARRAGLRLAPAIGVGCPGLIESDGRIQRGAQNLRGGWDDRSFNLPRSLADGYLKAHGRSVLVVMHNDAVVQGLSELPFARDVAHWGALTLGTGLGNARFTPAPLPHRGRVARTCGP